MHNSSETLLFSRQDTSTPSSLGSEAGDQLQSPLASKTWRSELEIAFWSWSPERTPPRLLPLSRPTQNDFLVWGTETLGPLEKIVTTKSVLRHI